jgi:riboflavin biosynthesis pyrimidine reductase
VTATDITALTPGSAPLDDDALAARYQAPTSPWLRVNFVTSIDGAASVDGRSGGLSSAADRRVFHLLRARCDALLVGAGTLRDERYGPLRPDGSWRRWRAARGLPADPVLVVLSRTLDLDPARAAFREAPRRPIVLAPDDAPADRRAALSGTTEVLTVGEHDVDLPAAVAMLRERGLHQLLSEGGPRLFGDLTAADLVDEVCLTVSPLLAGAGAGRITAGPASPASPARAMVLHHALTGGGALFLSYRRR